MILILSGLSPKIEFQFQLWVNKSQHRHGKTHKKTFKLKPANILRNERIQKVHVAIIKYTLIMIHQVCAQFKGVLSKILKQSHDCLLFTKKETNCVIFIC